MALNTRVGSGAALTTAEGDDNWDILNGINEAVTSTPRTVSIADENKTLELGSGSSVVHLPALPVAGIDSEIADFRLWIKNIDSTAKTINAYNEGDGTETFDNGVNSITLNQYEGVLIQGNAAANKWNIIGRAGYEYRTNIWSAVQTHTALVTWNVGADVLAATTLPLITDGNSVVVTDTAGPVTITDFASVGVGSVIKIKFDDAGTILAHDAVNLILPGAANITVAAGDVAEFVEYASADYRCTSYLPVGVTPGLLDTDRMTEDSALQGATQQSIKAYVDSRLILDDATQGHVVFELTATTGIMVQFGTVNTGGDGDASVAFSPNFSSTPYAVTLGMRGGSGGISTSSLIHAKSSTSFSFDSGNGVDNADYIAIGPVDIPLTG